MNRKIISKLAVLALCLVLCLCGTAMVFADSPTDEILNYEITADVNTDASVTLTYHIEWKVLESDGIGPVEWVNVGIPNSNYSYAEVLTDNIQSIGYDGNNLLRIDFNDSYYEDEVISFDFSIVQDSMYQMNALTDNETVYYFTPGWFNEISVDKLTIKWNSDKAVSWTGDCIIDGGYNVWTTSLGPGEMYSINVSYNNDAFEFDESRQMGSDGYDEGYYYNGYDDYYDGGSSFGVSAIFSFMPAIMIFVFIMLIKKAAQKSYEGGSGFAEGETETKVTRTKVVYFETCPGCGAPREEGKDECQYCGRSLIKSEEVIKEEDVKDEDKEALKYKNKGMYHYSSDPNTFVRVNVVHVPIITGGLGRGGSARGSVRGGGSRGGGCAHSSCACACVSCACACACACAGGGRAGCTTKDFYSSKLKLKQLEMKNRKAKNN